MKFNNHFLYNLKKQKLVFISLLIIIILFSICINSHFKEGNENMESDQSQQIELLKTKIYEEKEKFTIKGYELIGPEITSSHPLTQERINNIKYLISKSNYKIEKNKKLREIFKKLSK